MTARRFGRWFAAWIGLLLRVFGFRERPRVWRRGGPEALPWPSEEAYQAYLACEDQKMTAMMCRC